MGNWSYWAVVIICGVTLYRLFSLRKQMHSSAKEKRVLLRLAESPAFPASAPSSKRAASGDLPGATKEAKGPRQVLLTLAHKRENREGMDKGSDD